MARIKDPPFGVRGGLKALDYDRHLPIKNAGWKKRSIFGMRTGYIRNLGVAVVERPGAYPSARERVLAVYGHSQVTNGNPRAFPATGFVLDLEAAEQLAAMLLGGIAALRET